MIPLPWFEIERENKILLFQGEDVILMELDTSCERVRQFKSQLTITLDTWTLAIAIIESIEPDDTDKNRCKLDISFDNRHCGTDCRTANVTTLTSYLWACLQSNHSTSPFPFRVMAITSAESESISIYKLTLTKANGVYRKLKLRCT